MLTVIADELSCSFSDNNFCQWTRVGDILWQIETNIYDTHYVGPLSDHTTGILDAPYIDNIT